MTDVDGNLTTVSRDGSGTPLAIVGPFGQSTGFMLDSGAHFSSIADALGNAYQFMYSGDGLLKQTTTPRGGLYTYTYEAGTGRLHQDVDPVLGGTTLTNASAGNSGNVVTSTTAMGLVSTYSLLETSSGSEVQTVVGPDTLSTTTVRTPAAVSTTSPDGTLASVFLSIDPRFGMSAPLSSTTVTTPSGLAEATATTRSVTLSDPSNLLSVQTATTTTSVNGNLWTNSFNASGQTWTSTSPAGRTVVTTVDAAERPTSIAIPGINPMGMGYDPRGRVSSMSQGGQSWILGYDPQGHLASITDPSNAAVAYENDAIGQPRQTILADGRFIGTIYDADNNLSSLTTPANELHGFSYTFTDLLASYTPPPVSTPSPAAHYEHDLDGRIKLVTLPDTSTVAYGYDPLSGNLKTTTYSQGVITRSYNPATGRIASVTAASGESVAFGFDGFLPTSQTWSGAVTGVVGLGYNANFQVTSRTVDGSGISFGYDPDGLLTSAGTLIVSRSPQNGLISGTTFGKTTDAYTYDPNGRLASYTASYAGSAIYAETIVLRDPVGRIEQRTETIGTTTHAWTYGYDPNGRLTDVSEDGAAIAHYGYDPDDNRTTFAGVNGTVHPMYDAQDRLTSYGSTAYAFTPNGDLQSRTGSSGTTTYTYDPFGNLLSVAPPSGGSIGYIVDGENRRVEKTVGGAATTGLLYQDSLRPVAMLDGGGNVTSRFVFASRPNVPDYFTTANGTFRIISDHLGSPRLVVNTNDGTVVEEVDYDAFGNVTNDTSPGLQPFGFAGGIYDKDTGLVRFGVRDYDPATGRWTVKDPTRFDGEQINLYVYVNNDPVNEVDITGLQEVGAYPVTGPFNPIAWTPFPWHTTRNLNNRCPTSPPTQSTDGRTWTQDTPGFHSVMDACFGGPAGGPDEKGSQKWRADDGSECLYTSDGVPLKGAETYNYYPDPLGFGHIFVDFLTHVFYSNVYIGDTEWYTP